MGYLGQICFAAFRKNYTSINEKLEKSKVESNIYLAQDKDISAGFYCIVLQLLI